MSLPDKLLDSVPKSWLPTIVIALLVGLIAAAALAAHAKANDFVDGKVAPLRRVVKFDHAIMRHVFEHVEAEEARAGRPRHTLKQVKQEAEQSDDLLEE